MMNVCKHNDLQFLLQKCHPLKLTGQYTIPVVKQKHHDGWDRRTRICMPYTHIVENSAIFLSLRFYVKLLFENESSKNAIFSNTEALKV